MSNQMSVSKNPLFNYLNQRKTAIQGVLPKTMSIDRMMKISFSAASRNPKLLQADPESFYVALHSAAQLGLEPNTPLGQAYLIPYFNGKKKKTEVQFQIGYRGLITLLRRSGELANIFAFPVRKQDNFEIKYGLNPDLKHLPDVNADIDESGKDITHVYAVAKFKDGTYQMCVMSKKEVDLIRKRSRAANDGPWVTDYEQMALKTVIKRLCKYLPLTIELADAVDLDDKNEIDEIPNIKHVQGSTIDDEAPPFELEDSEVDSGTEKKELKQNLKARTKNKETKTSKPTTPKEPVKEAPKEKSKKMDPQSVIDNFQRADDELQLADGPELLDRIKRVFLNASKILDEKEFCNALEPIGMEECVTNPKAIEDYDDSAFYQLSTTILDAMKMKFGGGQR